MTSSTDLMKKEGQITSVSDTKGIELLICNPDWFDPKKTYTISNAPERTASLEFSGADLNFMARVLYAESSGSGQLPDKAERDKEKEAIMNVNHFRLNRKAYPSWNYIATTFRRVCEAPRQFESVRPDNKKLVQSAEGACEKLIKTECADLNEAIKAVQNFMMNGPNQAYVYDNFRGYLANGKSTLIGRSRFWLSERGGELFDKTP